jgi:predicted HTH transcriptional regulator
MKNPTALQDWTLDYITSLLTQGAFEPDSFDFKETLPHSKNASDKLHLRKTIAAFANSGGGFLIYGIKEDRDRTIQTAPGGVRVSGAC